MFLLERETSSRNWLAQDGGFEPYNFGPFQKVYQAVDMLAVARLIEDSSSSSADVTDTSEQREGIGLDMGISLPERWTLARVVPRIQHQVRDDGDGRNCDANSKSGQGTINWPEYGEWDESREEEKKTATHPRSHFHGMKLPRSCDRGSLRVYFGN